MKVLHVIPSLSPKRGGPSVAAPAMTGALIARGITCHIASTNDDGDCTLSVPTGDWTPWENVPTRFFPRAGSSFRLVREFQIGIGFSKWLKAHVCDYDLLHVHALFSHLPSTAMAIARRSGTPYVLRPLGLLEEYSLQRSAWKKALFLKLFDGENIRRASAIHLTSRRELEVSRIPQHSSCWIVPLGVNLPDISGRSTPGSNPSGSIRILFLSRWHEKKRIDVLLEALHIIRDLPWHLTLAGAGDPAITDRIASIIDRFQLADRIDRPGFLQREHKWSALTAADLFVLPSASENFGIAVAEALAAGVPPVITRHVALAEDIASAEAGWVCGDSPESLAHSLSSAIVDRTEIARRAANARHLAESAYSWPATATTLAGLYQAFASP